MKILIYRVRREILKVVALMNATTAREGGWRFWMLHWSRFERAFYVKAFYKIDDCVTSI